MTSSSVTVKGRDGVTDGTDSYIVRIQDVSHQALQGGRVIDVHSHIDIDVRGNEFVSIVGPSGCGKTTLLHMVAGLPPHFPPTEGLILVGDVEVRGPSRDRVMVFQDHAVYPWLTVEDNIKFGLPKKTRKTSQDLIDHYLVLTGLTKFRQSYPFQLSIGMRQRVGLARALAMQPMLLLLDEPFASVDALTRQELQAELLEIWQAERMTVLLVTHSVEEAIVLSTRVIVLSKPPSHVIGDIPITLTKARSVEALRQDVGYLKVHGEVSELLGVL